MKNHTQSHADVMHALLEDDQIREEWERTAFARAVANQVIRYRIAHGLSQRALAGQIGVSQPLIARLELGEHEPKLATLRKLSEATGMKFRIEIHPETERPADPRDGDVTTERVTRDGVELLVVAS